MGGPAQIWRRSRPATLARVLRAWSRRRKGAGIYPGRNPRLPETSGVSGNQLWRQREPTWTDDDGRGHRGRDPQRTLVVHMRAGPSGNSQRW